MELLKKIKNIMLMYLPSERLKNKLMSFDEGFFEATEGQEIKRKTKQMATKTARRIAILVIDIVLKTVETLAVAYLFAQVIKAF